MYWVESLWGYGVSKYIRTPGFGRVRDVALGCGVWNSGSLCRAMGFGRAAASVDGSMWHYTA